MTTDALVVVGASAGGIQALRSFLGRLPLDLPAAVLVVVHRANDGPSALDRILGRATSLPVRFAASNEPLANGQVRIAPPDLHLVVEDDTTRLVQGERERRQRPAIDPLLRSAARCYGRHVVAVILSGALDDGAAGAARVREGGGAVLVQDPDEALVPSMPRAALAAVPDAEVAAAADLGIRVAGIVEQWHSHDRTLG
jgi:two-component system chemotaxis response regulator CheB